MSLPYKILAIVLAPAGLYAGHAWDKHRAVTAAHAAGRAEVQADWLQERVEQQQLALVIEHEARVEEQAKAKATEGVLDGYRKQAKRASASAVAARSELDGLRDELAARDATAARDRAAGADPGAACRVDAGATERQLLGQCAGSITTLAADADEIKGRLTGPQAWVRGVCTNSR